MSIQLEFMQFYSLVDERASFVLLDALELKAGALTEHIFVAIITVYVLVHTPEVSKP